MGFTTLTVMTKNKKNHPVIVFLYSDQISDQSSVFALLNLHLVKISIFWDDCSESNEPILLTSTIHVARVLYCISYSSVPWTETIKNTLVSHTAALCSFINMSMATVYFELIQQTVSWCHNQSLADQIHR